MQALAGQLETSLLEEKEAVQAVRQTAREVLGTQCTAHLQFQLMELARSIPAESV